MTGILSKIATRGNCGLHAPAGQVKKGTGICTYRLSPEINMPFSALSHSVEQNTGVRMVLPRHLTLAVPYRMRLLTPDS